MPEETIFESALEKRSMAERSAYLDEACAGDLALRRRVEELLRAHEAAGNFLDRPALEQIAAGVSQPNDCTDATDPSVPAGGALAENQAGQSPTEPQEQSDSASDGQAVEFLAPSQKPGSLGRLGHYEIMAVVGRGGMGVVLKAFDEVLQRVVAIKVLAPQLATTATARKRFIREARAAAAVSHDHVVTIHAVDEGDGIPYLVMQFVDGISLQEKLDRTGPLGVKEILRIGLQTAYGLAAAHKQGLVHRDVKPANILLENGVERVKITDFGLARAVDDASLTQSGVVAGTPQYMSPEQANGEPVDHRSDLFSLGSVLYAMCTGRAPFRASTAMAVLKRVSEDTPRPVREVNPDIPDWLCAIIGKLHAKGPAARFQSAKEVAELLGQHLSYLQQPALAPMLAALPTAARTEPVLDGGRRRLIKRAVLVGLIALFLFFFGPSCWDFLRNQSVLEVTIEDLGLVKLILKRDGQIVETVLPGYIRKPLPPGTYELEAEFRPDKQLKNLVLQRTHLFVHEGFTQAMPNDRCTLHLRRGEHLALQFELTDKPATSSANLDPGWVQLFNGKDLTGWVVQDAFPGDWTVQDGVLVGKNRGDGGLTRLISKRGDLANFYLRAEVKINDGGNSGIWFRAPATGIDGYEAQINSTHKDTKTGTLMLKRGNTFRALHKIEQTSIPPDTWFGLDVIAVDKKLTVRVDGKTVAEAEDASHSRGHLALEAFENWTFVSFRKIEIKEVPATPSAEELAKLPSPLDKCKREDMPLSLLALAGGGDPDQAPTELVGILGDWRFRLPEVYSKGFMAQSLDGELLAVPCGNTVLLFHAPTGRYLRTLNHGDYVYRVVFSPDSKRLASASRDKLVKLWDAKTGQLTMTLEGHESGVFGLAFSPDGKRLASGSHDKTVKVWDTQTRAVVHTLAHNERVHTVVFSPDGKRLVSAGTNKSLKVWDAQTGKDDHTLLGNEGVVSHLAFSRDGKRLAAGSDYELTVWDTATLRKLQTLKTSADGLTAFTPDGRTLIAGKNDQRQDTAQTITRWDMDTGHELAALPLKPEGDYASYQLSPDGKTLFAVTINPAHIFVRVYDAATGQERFPHQGHTGRVLAVAVSPDGCTLASGGSDHTVRLWVLANGQAGNGNPAVRILERHTDEVWSVAFSPDGKLLASGSFDSTIILWDVATGKELRTLTGHSKTNSLVAFSPDGQTVAAGGEDSGVKLWDVATGKPKDPLHWHTGVVRAVAFSPDGKLLASAGQDQTVQLCELATGRRIHKFQAPGAMFITVAFSPDGKSLVSGTLHPDNMLRVWDLDTKKEMLLSGHTDHIHGLAVQPAGHLVATGAKDGTVRFWDLSSGVPRVLTVGPGPFGKGVWHVAFTPEGRYLTTANENGTISILRASAPPGAYAPGSPELLPKPEELAKRLSPADALRRNDIPLDLLTKAAGGKPDTLPQLVAVLGGEQGHKMQVWSVAISPDGKTLASAGQDKTVRLWDLATGKRRHTLTGHGDSVRYVAFSPNGRLLASTSFDKTVKVWDVATGKERQTLLGHTALVERVAFAPDGRTLASASDDSTLRLWDIETGKTVRTFTGHGSPSNGVGFSPDGKLLASASHDSVVRLWDVSAGWELAKLTGHKGLAGRVAFHPDGRTLASAGADGRICLWDLTTRQLKQTLEGQQGIIDLAWSPDGRFLASCALSEGKIKLWDVTGTAPRSKDIQLFPPGGAFAQYAHGIAFAPDGRHLATANPGDGHPNGDVYVLRLAKPGEVFQVGKESGINSR